MSSRVMFIVNPNANHGSANEVAIELRSLFEGYGGGDWVQTLYPKHAVEIAHKASEGQYDILIVGGGDGTLHEVVNGLMRVSKERRPFLGIVPLGSGNDFSYSLGIDPRPKFALEQVFKNVAQSIDVGCLNIDIEENLGAKSEYWINTLGIGFDTIVLNNYRRIKFIKGFFAYLLAVLHTILAYHDAPIMRIETDRESWVEALLMFVVCNGVREGGGFMVTPHAHSDDGIFNYACVKDVSRLMMLRLLPEVMRGTHRRFKQVRMGELTRLRLEADQPLYIHTDGETITGFGSDVRCLEASVLPGEIMVLM